MLKGNEGPVPFGLLHGVALCFCLVIRMAMEAVGLQGRGP